MINADATALPFEDGRFSAALSFTMLHHIPTVELQDQMFGEIARVLRPRGIFVAADSLASPGMAEFHHGDTYNPVDPATLPERLARTGFRDIEVRDNGVGWALQTRA